MKKTFIPILIILLSGCYTQYPTTTFWINNNTNKTVNFRASIYKANLPPPSIMSLPFTIEPGDSVLFRQVGFHKQGNPAKVFKEMNFIPVDKKMNNPKDSISWIKSTDTKGLPKYNFYIYPNK
jgi:hypothetical protein